MSYLLLFSLSLFLSERLSFHDTFHVASDVISIAWSGNVVPQERSLPGISSITTLEFRPWHPIATRRPISKVHGLSWSRYKTPIPSTKSGRKWGKSSRENGSCPPVTCSKACAVSVFRFEIREDIARTCEVFAEGSGTVALDALNLKLEYQPGLSMWDDRSLDMRNAISKRVCLVDLLPCAFGYIDTFNSIKLLFASPLLIGNEASTPLS